MSGYAAALLLTLAVETPLYGLALRRWAGRPWRQALLAGLLVNAGSHPLAFLVLHPALGGDGLGTLALVEAAVVAFETGCLWLWLRRDAALLAGIVLVANALSLGLGALLPRAS